MNQKVTILAGDEAVMEKAVKRLNRHATRMGYSEAKVLSISKEREGKRFVYNKSEDGDVSERSYTMTVKDVELDIPEQFVNSDASEYLVLGQVVSAEGLPEVVAASEHVAEVGKAAEGFNWKCSACKHGLGRAFVVKHVATGRTEIVGSECIKQYTAGDAAAIIALIEFVAVLQFKDGCGEEGAGGGGHKGSRYEVIDLERFLAVALAVSERDGGYVKRWETNDMGDSIEVSSCTRNNAVAQFLGVERDYAGVAKMELASRFGVFTCAKIGATDGNLVDAAALIEAWAAVPTVKADGSVDDYAAQCKFLAERGWLTEKTAGVAASMVKGPRKPPADLSGSLHVGVVGERVVMQNLRVVMSIEREGDYGITNILKFVSPEGNVVTWFASGAKGWDKDHVVSLKATVKSHGEYKGVKETVITRAKELEA